MRASFRQHLRTRRRPTWEGTHRPPRATLRVRREAVNGFALILVLIERSVVFEHCLPVHKPAAQRHCVALRTEIRVRDRVSQLGVEPHTFGCSTARECTAQPSLR
jgi:hypothetical protein